MKQRFYQWLSDLCYRIQEQFDSWSCFWSYKAQKAGIYGPSTEEYNELVQSALRAHLPEIVKNVSTNNALYGALMKKDRK